MNKINCVYNILVALVITASIHAQEQPVYHLIQDLNADQKITIYPPQSGKIEGLKEYINLASEDPISLETFEQLMQNQADKLLIIARVELMNNNQLQHRFYEAGGLLGFLTQSNYASWHKIVDPVSKLPIQRIHFFSIKNGGPTQNGPVAILALNEEVTREVLEYLKDLKLNYALISLITKLYLLDEVQHAERLLAEFPPAMKPAFQVMVADRLQNIVGDLSDPKIQTRLRQARMLYAEAIASPLVSDHLKADPKSNLALVLYRLGLVEIADPLNENLRQSRFLFEEALAAPSLSPRHRATSLVVFAEMLQLGLGGEKNIQRARLLNEEALTLPSLAPHLRRIAEARLEQLGNN